MSDCSHRSLDRLALVGGWWLTRCLCDQPIVRSFLASHWILSAGCWLTAARGGSSHKYPARRSHVLRGITPRLEVKNLRLGVEPCLRITDNLSIGSDSSASTYPPESGRRVKAITLPAESRGMEAEVITSGGTEGSKGAHRPGEDGSDHQPRHQAFGSSLLCTSSWRSGPIVAPPPASP